MAVGAFANSHARALSCTLFMHLRMATLVPAPTSMSVRLHVSMHRYEHHAHALMEERLHAARSAREAAAARVASSPRHDLKASHKATTLDRPCVDNNTKGNWRHPAMHAVERLGLAPPPLGNATLSVLAEQRLLVSPRHGLVFCPIEHALPTGAMLSWLRLFAAAIDASPASLTGDPCAHGDAGLVHLSIHFARGHVHELAYVRATRDRATRPRCQ